MPRIKRLHFSLQGNGHLALRRRISRFKAVDVSHQRLAFFASRRWTSRAKEAHFSHYGGGCLASKACILRYNEVDISR